MYSGISAALIPLLIGIPLVALCFIWWLHIRNVRGLKSLLREEPVAEIAKDVARFNHQEQPVLYPHFKPQPTSPAHAHASHQSSAGQRHNIQTRHPAPHSDHTDCVHQKSHGDASGFSSWQNRDSKMVSTL